MVVSFRGCLGDIRCYRTVEHSSFGLGFERMVLFATGIYKMRDGHPKPHQQPQGYADASLQGSVKIELPAGIYAVKNSVSENMQPFIVLETLSHVTPPIPKSSSFFADYGMDNGFFQKKALHQKSRKLSFTMAGSLGRKATRWVREFLYRVTEDSLMERLNTNMHEACLQIDKDCRVFTIHGSDDTIVRAKEALEFVEIIPNHKLHVVKGANHGFSKHQDELISVVFVFHKRTCESQPRSYFMKGNEVAPFRVFSHTFLGISNPRC
ncbi:alpha/beta hydrolases superfamily protein [Tanacetum coccineum]